MIILGITFLYLLYLHYLIIKLCFTQYNQFKNINNTILEQNLSIIKINDICKEKLLSKISSSNHFYNKHNTFIILFLLYIILLFLHIYIIVDVKIAILLIIIDIIIIYLIIKLNENYIKQFNEIIYNKNLEIISKHREINNIYLNDLINIIDNNDDIYYINNSIDEYLYGWLKKNIDKFKYINIELKNKLIENKKFIIEDDLEEYKNKLEIKINELNKLIVNNNITIVIN